MFVFTFIFISFVSICAASIQIVLICSFLNCAPLNSLSLCVNRIKIQLIMMFDKRKRERNESSSSITDAFWFCTMSGVYNDKAHDTRSNGKYRIEKQEYNFILKLHIHTYTHARTHLTGSNFQWQFTQFRTQLFLFSFSFHSLLLSSNFTFVSYASWFVNPDYILSFDFAYLNWTISFSRDIWLFYGDLAIMQDLILNIDNKEILNEVNIILNLFFDYPTKHSTHWFDFLFAFFSLLFRFYIIPSTI